MAKLIQAHGNWVAGEGRFWNRTHELAHFIQALEEGACLYMTAQRRIGKTSLMREAARRLEDRFICLHIDLQKARAPEDLIVELSKATRPHQNLWRKTRSVFGNIFSQASNAIDEIQVDEVTLKIREGLVGGNWQAKGDRLLDELAQSERPVILFMDEVPILVNRLLKGRDYTITAERIAAVDALMSWLRDNSIRHRGIIRMVITGSIGLEPLLRQAKLSATINNFQPFHLEPWTAEVAVGCLEALANNYGVQFEPGAGQRVAECLGCCIPHHVQMFFDHIYRVCQKRGDMVCTVDDVDATYKHHMLSNRGHAELQHFEERLSWMVDETLHPFLLDLLTETALAGRLSPRALAFYSKDYGLDNPNGRQAIREILHILEHDGYLQQQANGYVFISNLLRDWWSRRFGFGFTLAAEREN